MEIRKCYTDLSVLKPAEIIKLSKWLKGKFSLNDRMNKDDFESLKSGELNEYWHLGFEEESDMLWLSDYGDQLIKPRFKKLDLKTFIEQYEKEIKP